MLSSVALIVAGYLIGSISTAIIVCRALALPDPRTEGSRNPGATNVLRIGGKKAAALTLIGDFLKGLLPVAVAQIAQVSPTTLACVGMAAFLGHLYPLFFDFKGGKGVATAAGVLIGFSWQLGLAAALVWLTVAKLLRISSAAALTATALTPVLAWWLALPGAVTISIWTMCALVLWRHRDNIRRLRNGSEGAVDR
jgi:glycerol-3-phosphate acyltransferase PlsY